MSDMTIDEFGKKHRACAEGLEWAKENCKTGMMSEAWEKLNISALRGYDPCVSFLVWVFNRLPDPGLVRRIYLEIVTHMPTANNGTVASSCSPFDVYPIIETAYSYISGNASAYDLDMAISKCSRYIDEYSNMEQDAVTGWSLYAVKSCVGLDYWIYGGKTGCIKMCLNACACSALSIDVRRDIVAHKMRLSDFNSEDRALFECQWGSSRKWIIEHISNMENPFR